jgi:uncharacterized protein YkwD
MKQAGRVLLSLALFLVTSAFDATNGHLRIVAAASAGADRVATSAAVDRNTNSAPATTLYHWEPLVLPGNITTDTVTSLAVSPLDAYTVFLGTKHGLYKSSDAGLNWTQIGAPTLDYIFEVITTPSDPQQVYVRSWQIHRSADGGNSWQQLASPPDVCGMTVAPSTAQRLYLRGCHESNAAPVLRSDDGGQTWIAPSLTFTKPLDTLVVSPVDPNLVIGTDFDEVFRSTDGGATWVNADVGVRYAGKAVFDPNSPHTLYIGHWTGLLRSLDGGQTWEDSYAHREFIALTPSPFAAGEVLGGDDTGSWRFTSADNAWSVTAWDAPLPLQTLWASAGGKRVLYARSSSGLWRYGDPVVKANFAIYLPVVQREGATIADTTVQQMADTTPTTTFTTTSTTASRPISTAAQQALDRMNVYRMQAGVAPLRLHPALVAAAQNHATYSLLNHADPAAWTNGPHGEVAGKPGFTGKVAGERAIAAGYTSGSPWWAGSEVKHGLGDPIASVDSWMATIYHRVIPLDPGAAYMGYGNGGDDQYQVDVMDFGGGPTDSGVWASAKPYPLAYPSDGQTDVPTSWNGAESPNPLPPGTTGPVGYPFTLQRVGGPLQVDTATLLDGNGQPVAVHPSPAHCGDACYALIAIAPLQPNTTYTVQAQGNVGGVPFSRTWSFTTGTGEIAYAAALMSSQSTDPLQTP